MPNNAPSNHCHVVSSRLRQRSNIKFLLNLPRSQEGEAIHGWVGKLRLLEAVKHFGEVKSLFGKLEIVGEGKGIKTDLLDMQNKLLDTNT